jgi:metallo-beta-lactamase superfamily protein
MIHIEALPADDGDCLWIEWPDEDGATHRMLIDGGRGNPGRIPPGLAARLARQPADQRAFDLMVCTHIDVDHIGGLLALAENPPPGFRVADVWFNGRRHLDLLGPAQGDILSAALARHSMPWNRAFGGAAVVVPPGDGLPVAELPGLRITLLSPTRAQLAVLARSWPRVLAEAELRPMRPSSGPCGRSIPGLRARRFSAAASARSRSPWPRSALPASTSDPPYPSCRPRPTTAAAIPGSGRTCWPTWPRDGRRSTGGPAVTRTWRPGWPPTGRRAMKA